MLLKATGHCAACHGLIVGMVHTLVWYGTDIDLCTSCMRLGDGTPKDDATLVAIASQRANPNAPVSDLEGAVREWISAREREGGGSSDKTIADVFAEVEKPQEPEKE